MSSLMFFSVDICHVGVVLDAVLMNEIIHLDKKKKSSHLMKFIFLVFIVSISLRVLIFFI